MGRVLFYVEKVNRIGLAAHVGDAVGAAMFNKDLLLRARAAAKDPTGRHRRDRRNGRGSDEVGPLARRRAVP